MSVLWWMAPIAVTLVVLLAILLWPQVRQQREAARFQAARRRFHLRREWLEAYFLKMAAASGKPRDLVWDDCDFEDEAAFATDRDTGQLRAFVGLTIGFRAVEGGDLELNANVESPRAATAVFLFTGRDWVTEGRAIFNLNPLEAIQHFHHELECLD